MRTVPFYACAHGTPGGCAVCSAFAAHRERERELRQTLLDVTNALAESISNTHPYARIVDQARKLLRETPEC